MSGVEGEMREPFERFCGMRVELDLGDLDSVRSREDGRETGERVLPGDGRFRTRCRLGSGGRC